MTIYVILQCSQFHENDGSSTTLLYDKFLAVEENEEEARAFIDYYSEDQKSFRTAMGTYIRTRKESPNDLYPYGAICVESADVDILYYYKTVDIDI